MSNYNKWERAADRDALGDYLFLMLPFALILISSDGWLQYAAIAGLIGVAVMASVKVRRLLKNKVE